MNRALVILAAGQGTRFHELGKLYPKCLLPINKEPLLVKNINTCQEHYSKITIVVSNETILDIKQCLSECLSLEVMEKINFIYQVPLGNIKGPGVAFQNALSYYREFFPDYEELTLLLGDILLEAFNPIMFFDENTLSYKEVNDFSRWCMISDDGAEIFDKPQSKPHKHCYALTGLYHFKNINDLSDIEAGTSSTINNEYQISYFLEQILPVRLYHAPIIDCGTIKDWKFANKVSSCRQFNSVTPFTNGSMLKRSRQLEKLHKEYSWLNSPIIKSFESGNSVDLLNVKPVKVFHSNPGSYNMEYIDGMTLRDKALFFDRSYESWVKIFRSLGQWIMQNKMSYNKDMATEFHRWVMEKTEERIKTYEHDFADVSPILEKVDDAYWNIRVEASYSTGIVHGDLCFSNIILKETDSDQTLYLIDPRGEMFGSIYYDAAKLYHSVYGLYDVIDSKLYLKTSIDYFAKQYVNIQKAFREEILSLFSPAEQEYIKYLTATLFLSMVPLHHENKTELYEMGLRIAG